MTKRDYGKEKIYRITFRLTKQQHDYIENYIGMNNITTTKFMMKVIAEYIKNNKIV